MINNEHFNEVLTRQASRQKREITPINYAVAELIATTADKAISDTRQNLPIKTFNVVSAPTGSSKTQSAIAFTIMKYLSDPDFTCAFVVEEIKHAQEIFEELSQEIASKDLGVWTSYHDVQKHKSLDVSKYGFVPTLTTLEEVKSKRIAIYTHSKWLNEIESTKDFGVRKFRGKLRDVLFIDEQPSFIELIEKTPADILMLRDTLAKHEPNHHLIEILTEVYKRMEEVFTSKGDEMVGVELVEFLEAYNAFTEEEAFSFCREHTTGNVSMFVEGFKFLNACAMGYCFLTRRTPIGFVAYLPTFKPEPNQIILDATADLSELYPLFGGSLVEGLPSIDYSNLTITQIEPPLEFNSIRKVVNIRGLAVEYARWIKQAVMANTKAGDKVLVVVHKDMFSTHDLLPYATQEPDTEVCPDRAVYFINWGQGIGSNQFKECTEVFMFGEFHQPKRVTVANTLGAKRVMASKSDIHTQNGSLTGEYKTVREGELLRWFKQLASRGNVRNIDAQGVCGKMNLHTSMDFNRLISSYERLFPSTNTPKRNLEYYGDSHNNKRPKYRKKLIDLLSTTNLNQISFKQIEDLVGIKSNELSRELKANSVIPTVLAYGWTIVSSRDLNKSGKGKWLLKEKCIYS